MLIGFLGRWLAVGSVLLATAIVPVAAADAGKIYTVANFPVDATAEDAVKAKTKALADGEQGALRALLKRLVPVKGYPRLTKIKPPKAQTMLEAFAVKQETNSPTQYIATLDFTFSAKAVQSYLRSNGLPFLDEPAPAVVLVPVWRAPSAARPAAGKAAKTPATAPSALPASLAPGPAGKAWHEAWRGLDLEHTLTPLTLKPMKADIHQDAVGQLVDGDTSPLRIFNGEYGTQTLIIAIAEPDPTGRKLLVTYVGEDAVGPIFLKRAFRMQAGDLAYTAEYAAVVGLGILEGRWKSVKVKTPLGPMVSAGSLARSDELQLAVEFNGLEEWDEMSRKLGATTGVSQLQPVTLNPQGGEVRLRYAGAIEDLRRALYSQGLMLQNKGGLWVLAAN